MKIKFNSMENIEEFVDLASHLESDISVGPSAHPIDGKSAVGMLQVHLGEEMRLEIVEKDEKEVKLFLSNLQSMRILVE